MFTICAQPENEIRWSLIQQKELSIHSIGRHQMFIKYLFEEDDFGTHYLSK